MGIDDHKCGLRVFSHGGGVRGVAQAPVGHDFWRGTTLEMTA
jgi:hypothetical protein